MNGDEAAHVGSKALNSNQRMRNKYNSFHSKVDINDLLSRVREDEKKQKKRKFSFFWFSCSSSSCNWNYCFSII